MEQVILVDQFDNELGSIEKMEAHQLGVLHRAFSVFIFDKDGRMLLQQRALHKYHSGGLWTNACCSHPRPGEQVESAAKRRLTEEIGIETDLEPMFNFTYKATFENGLTEHEFDHVFYGQFNGKLVPNEQEVMSVRFATIEDISRQIREEPARFTAWFLIAFNLVKAWLEENGSRIILK